MLIRGLETTHSPEKSCSLISFFQATFSLGYSYPELHILKIFALEVPISIIPKRNLSKINSRTRQRNERNESVPSSQIRTVQTR